MPRSLGRMGCANFFAGAIAPVTQLCYHKSTTPNEKMKNDEPAVDSDAAKKGPHPKVLEGLQVLATSCTEEMWTRFMEDLSCRAAKLVKKYSWIGVRPDSGGPNDSPGKQINVDLAKRWNDLAVEGYRKVADGSWEWDPTSERYTWWRSEYPDWPPELVSLYGFIWDRLRSHVDNLNKLDYYKYGAAPVSADEEHTAASSTHEKEPAVSAPWDKEAQELDHTAGEFSNLYKLAPYQKLVLREDWDELIKKISSPNYEDRELILKIAEICKAEIMSWENRKRKGYVQKKGAEPRELVEDIFGIEYKTLPKDSPMLTSINKAKGKLKKILTLVGVERCIEAGRPEFAVIYRYLRDDAPEDDPIEAIIASLAGKFKKSPSDIMLLLKEFAEHWIHWFKRHYYFEDPGLPCPIRVLKPSNK